MRSGYSDDYENDAPYPNAMALYRNSVKAAFRGKRGRAFMQELLEALDAMPEKRLTEEYLQRDDGAVCAIGSVGVRRGTKMDDLDVEDAQAIGKRFGIAECMVREIEHVNDNDFAAFKTETPEQRWARVRAWVVKTLETPDKAV